jgi:hypothetical protein
MHFVMLMITYVVLTTQHFFLLFATGKNDKNKKKPYLPSLLSFYEDLCIYKCKRSSHLMILFSFCIGPFLSTKMRIWSSSLIILLLLLCVTVATYANDDKLYANHQLWRLYATSSEQIGKILAFSHISHLHNIDFWSENFHIHEPVSFYSNLFSLIIIDDFIFLNR